MVPSERKRSEVRPETKSVLQPIQVFEVVELPLPSEE